MACGTPGAEYGDSYSCGRSCIWNHKHGISRKQRTFKRRFGDVQKKLCSIPALSYHSVHPEA